MNIQIENKDMELNIYHTPSRGWYVLKAIVPAPQHWINLANGEYAELALLRDALIKGKVLLHGVLDNKFPNKAFNRKPEGWVVGGKIGVQITELEEENASTN